MLTHVVIRQCSCVIEDPKTCGISFSGCFQSGDCEIHVLLARKTGHAAAHFRLHVQLISHVPNVHSVTITGNRLVHMLEAITLGFVIRDILQPLGSILRFKPNAGMAFGQNRASNQRVESSLKHRIIGMAFLRLHPSFVNWKSGVVEQCLKLVERLGITSSQSKPITAKKKAGSWRLMRNCMLGAGDHQHFPCI
jgi:hypothetical protein